MAIENILAEHMVCCFIINGTPNKFFHETIWFVLCCLPLPEELPPESDLTF
jgi:hypothetical protein